MEMEDDGSIWSDLIHYQKGSGFLSSITFLVCQIGKNFILGRKELSNALSTKQAFFFSFFL